MALQFGSACCRLCWPTVPCIPPRSDRPHERGRPLALAASARACRRRRVPPVRFRVRTSDSSVRPSQKRGVPTSHSPVVAEKPRDKRHDGDAHDGGDRQAHDGCRERLQVLQHDQEGCAGPAAACIACKGEAWDSQESFVWSTGETHELRQELANPSREKKKDAVKKVIANMTVGKDVSMLFTDVVNCIQTGTRRADSQSVSPTAV
jgi:hypothetical protein